MTTFKMVVSTVADRYGLCADFSPLPLPGKPGNGCHINLYAEDREGNDVAKYAAALKILPTASFKRRDCDREALERKMLKHRHIVVSGWFVRYYDLFLKYRNEIVDLFTLDEQYTAPVKSKMQEEEKLSTLNSQLSTLRLGVHIRRGDYAQWSTQGY